MPTTPNLSAESFDITKVSLFTERFSVPSSSVTGNRAEDESINILNMCIDIVIFENITRPYLTCTLVMVDDLNLSSIPGIQGTERITVEFGSPLSSDFIKKTFFIKKIKEYEKYNERTDVLVLSLVEDIAFYDSVLKISKSYEGTGEQIVTKILSDNLKKDLYRPDTYFLPSKQNKFRYLTPYESPFSAINKVLSNMTTDTSLPYFLYSTIYSNDLVLTDLESIITRGSFNQTPFVYSNLHMKNKSPVNEQAFQIISYKANDIESTMDLLQDGALGVNFTEINLSTAETFNNEFDINKVVIDNLINKNVLPPEQIAKLTNTDVVIPDPTFENETKLSSYFPSIKTAIATDNFPLEPELDGFNESDINSKDTKVTIKNGVLGYLTKNVYQYYIPGLIFLDNSINRSVGSLIKIEVLRNQGVTNQGSKAIAKPDEVRTGKSCSKLKLKQLGYVCKDLLSNLN